MSSASVETPAAVKQPNSKGRKSTHLNTSNSQRKKLDRNCRKRSKSFSGCLNKIKSMKPVLPTKFLLGGNINDPLNLNSLQDEEINRAMNAVTPKSSPIPTPPRRKGRVEVIIPSNIHDPLNLIDCADDAEYEQQLASPVKKGRKKRMKRKRTTSACLESTVKAESTGKPEAKTPEANEDSAKIPEQSAVEAKPKEKELSLELNAPSPVKKESKKRKSEEHKEQVKKFKNCMDKIVSPVIPQPGAWLKRKNILNNWKPKPKQNANANEKLPAFKEKDKQFQYGNYNRYYGYRNPENEVDHRLKCFSYHRYLFEGKDILDIGCNIGHITLSVARDFGAKSVLGIDIDKNLIGIARKNTKYYVKSTDTSNDEMPKSDDVPKSNCEFFPISMPILYGPIDIPGFSGGNKRQFPHNVTFKQGNYILEDDSLLSLEQPQFDVILCLSITKWIHLNWGDAGIKHAFRRMYAQLRPGGKLILEPQNWASYKRKKTLTETIYKNYRSIEFLPDKFMEYLLSPAVGFAKSEILGYPHHHHSKGFQRHVQVYTKSTMFPSERVEGPPMFAMKDCERLAHNDNSTSFRLEEDDSRVSGVVSENGEFARAYERNGETNGSDDARDCKPEEESKFAEDVKDNFLWDNT